VSGSEQRVGDSARAGGGKMETAEPGVQETSPTEHSRSSQTKFEQILSGTCKVLGTA